MLIIDKCRATAKRHSSTCVLAKYHLEELGLPMGITDYELKKVLPTKAQLAKCVADAERQIELTQKGSKK